MALFQPPVRNPQETLGNPRKPHSCSGNPEATPSKCLHTPFAPLQGFHPASRVSFLGASNGCLYMSADVELCTADVPSASFLSLPFPFLFLLHCSWLSTRTVKKCQSQTTVFVGQQWSGIRCVLALKEEGGKGKGGRKGKEKGKRKGQGKGQERERKEKEKKEKRRGKKRKRG